MRPEAVVEDIPEFETEVIGITCVNGIPSGIIFFHEGMMLGADFTEEQVHATPTIGNYKNRPVTTINAPEGMSAVVKGTKLTRNYSKDFRMIRQTTTSFEVVSLRRH